MFSPFGSSAGGGVYVYLREAYSPALGFLWGWAILGLVLVGLPVYFMWARKPTVA